MKVINAKDMTDVQWISYIKLLRSIKEKFNEDNYCEYDGWEEYRNDHLKEESNWKEFRKLKLETIESEMNQFLNEYSLIMENDEVVAWVAMKIANDEVDFLYDTIYDHIQPELIQTILKCVYDYIVERGKNFAYYATDKSRRSDPLKKINAEVYFEAAISKLSREDMNIKYWKDIVETNKFADNYDLEFHSDIPENVITEEMHDKYVDLINEYIIDKEFFNPSKHVPRKYTKENLIARIESEKNDTDLKYTYILFDKKEIAAFYTIYLMQNGKTVVGGGITYVTRNYRGKNLGKYLKAKMYLKVIEDFPEIEYILSNTFPWNKFMHKINEDMGFKPFGIELKFIFSKEFLENYLKQ